MAVVAEVNDDADRFLRMVVGGWPLSSSVMQAAANFGAIPLRDGSMQATAKPPPFDGDEYGVFAFIETVVLVNEAQGSERLSYNQRLMLNPMIRAATQELVAVEDGAVVARYTTDNTSEMLEPEERRTASAKLAYHRNLREGLLKISESPEKTYWWQPSRCRAFRFLAPWMPRRSSFHEITTTARWRGAARRLAGPLRAKRQSRP